MSFNKFITCIHESWIKEILIFFMKVLFILICFWWIFIKIKIDNGTSINNVRRFLVIFDLPTYLVLPYNVQFGGLSWTPLPTIIFDIINGRSHLENRQSRSNSPYFYLFLHAANQNLLWNNNRNNFAIICRKLSYILVNLCKFHEQYHVNQCTEVLLSVSFPVDLLLNHHRRGNWLNASLCSVQWLT